MDQKVEVAVITTGGTIDKSYDERAGSMENRGSQIREQILSNLRLPYTSLWILPILNKDSLNITDRERGLLIEAIKQQVERGVPVVVLHGTDTMDVSAKKFFDETPNPSVPVVFTGAMLPADYKDSDAYQNVTEALLAVKVLPAGVYVSFHNHIFKVPNVKKNKEKSTFESLD